MKTVGEFKKAGLVFVNGDVYCHKGSTLKMLADGITLKWFERDAKALNATIMGFAWRENTGVKPEFSGAIDVITESWDSGDCHSKTHYASTLNWSNHCLNKVIKWRPSLNHPSAAKPDTKQSAEEKRMDIIGQNGNDGLHYDNTAQQVEALFADGMPNNMKFVPITGVKTKQLNHDDSQIFTQAMADAGELPHINCRCLVKRKDADETWAQSDFNERIILCYGKELVIFANQANGDYKETVGRISDYIFKPIDTRTDREKAIDEMASIISLRTRDGAKEVCGELYDAGYRKC